MKKLVNIYLFTIGIIFINGCSAPRVDVIESSSEFVKLENVTDNNHQKKLIVPKNQNPICFEYLHYRPVEYETQYVQENENVHPNKGGLIYAYYKNISNKPITLAHWRWNNFDESVWRLDNLICWDRGYGSRINPGQTSVLEINAISEDFAENNDYNFEFISKNTWKSVLSHSGKLIKDKISIPLIRFKKGLRMIDIHVRNSGGKIIEIEEVEIIGKQKLASNILGRTLSPNGHAIASIELKKALNDSELVIIKVNINENGKIRSVMAHRRAFEDYFPIGTWGAKRGDYLMQRQHHIDTCVEGSNLESEFYVKEAKQYGYKSLATINYNDTHSLKVNRKQNSIACLQLSDEPDWVTHPQQVLLQDSIARNAYPYAPTMTTLCRNVTFFEYAPIVDLPCMDHYCVTAPSTSKWPSSYGTKLEETGYYTKDLKFASEPKPIWVWSQGLFDWDERPKQTVPTPEELAVQLVQNIGNGAKGILWFTFRKNPGLKYPKTKNAIREWGRVLRLIREDLLGSEPILHENIDSPSNVDVMALVNNNRIILCVTNKDYKMHQNGYKFNKNEKAEIKISLPSWISPKNIVKILPKGVKGMDCDYDNNGNIIIEIDNLRDAMVIAISNSEQSGNAFKARFKSILLDESRDFSRGVDDFVDSYINGKPILNMNITDASVGAVNTSIDLDNIYINVSEIKTSSDRVNNFIKSNSVRISSSNYDEKIDHDCYLNPDGLVVLTVSNRNNEKRTVLVNQENLNFIKTIPAQSIGTYLWPVQ